jgi:hypothetical protein
MSTMATTAAVSAALYNQSTGRSAAVLRARAGVRATARGESFDLL